jgi:ubiquitin-protein ligase
MTPRLRRLQADYERVWHALNGHPHIQLAAVEGEPPERYMIDFHLQSLVPQGETGFLPGSVHRAEIFLPLDYPRRAPVCRMLTPVFHPNIDPQKICIGDHWSAGQTLPLLISRIAQMLSYQSYNVKSPLNAAAAAWAERHAAQLPTDRGDFVCG